MDKLRLAICDDDNGDCQYIKRCIDRYMIENGYLYDVDVYYSGEAFLGSGLHYDILLLDIAMGDGIDGIMVGQKVKSNSRDTKIIYSTSYGEYMESAINNVHAFSFLTKPYSELKIFQQLNEAVDYLQNHKRGRCEIRFEVTDQEKGHHTDVTLKKFFVDDIYYFECVGRKIKIVTSRGNYYYFNQMKNLQIIMQEYGFESCHQSFLVNLKHIKRIKGYNLLMNNGDLIPVSQKKSAQFRNQLNRFIQKNVEVL